MAQNEVSIIVTSKNKVKPGFDEAAKEAEESGSKIQGIWEKHADNINKALGNIGKGGGVFAGASGLLAMASPLAAAGLAVGAFAAVAIPELTKVQAAMSQTGKAGQKAWKNLTPEEKNLGMVLKNVSSAFAAVQKSLTPIIDDVASFAGQLAIDLLPALGKMAQAGGQVLDSFLMPLDRFVTSKVFSQLIDQFAKFAVTAGNLVGPALVQLLKLLMQLFVDLMPTGVQLLKVLLPLFLQIVQDLTPAIVVFAKITAAVLNWLTQTHLLKPILLGLVPVIMLLVGSSGIGALLIAVSLIAAGIVELSRNWHKIWTDIKNWALDAVNFITGSWGKYLFPGLYLIIKIAEYVRDHWHTIWTTILNVVLDFVKISIEEFKFFLDVFLSVVGAILHGAAVAFGWVPGVGGKLRSADREFQSFKSGLDNTFNGLIGKVQSFQDHINGLHGRTVNVVLHAAGSGSIYFNETTGVGGDVKGGLKFMAGGGRLPGFGGGDSIPALLEPGEAVIDKHRTQRLAGLFKAMGVPGFVSGGYVPNPGGLPGWVGGIEGSFGHNVENSFAVRMINNLKNAVKKAAAASAGFINYHPGGGVAQWLGLVDQALRMEGLSAGLDSRVLYQMQTESGGNPNAINNWDINAKMGDPSRGLMQVIMSTFRAYHWPGTSWNIYDPLANIAAGINYARHVYGPGLEANGMGIGSGRGYAAGGATSAGWAMVGEHGRELVKLPGGATVYPGGGTGVTGLRIILELGSSFQKAGLSKQQLEDIRYTVRTLGGGDVQRALGKN